MGVMPNAMPNVVCVLKVVLDQQHSIMAAMDSSSGMLCMCRVRNVTKKQPHQATALAEEGLETAEHAVNVLEYQALMKEKFAGRKSLGQQEEEDLAQKPIGKDAYVAACAKYFPQLGLQFACL